MNKCIVIIYRLCLLAFFFLQEGYSIAQTNVEVFGQNRVQYRRFDWKYYDADHFKIYHYDRSGRELARYVAEQAEQDVTAIERRLGGLFPERLNIILYNSHDDYEQNNIGLNSGLFLQNNNPAGTVNLVGDKLVLYFTGVHADLKRQLRQGMAQVVMERLMFGENFREMVRNAVLLSLPKWVTTGYVDYVVDGWTSNDDNDWKNILTPEGKVHFENIAEYNPRLAGKAFWKYIAVKYGENNVRNLLYLTQLKSSLNKALMLSIEQKLKATCDSAVVFYRNRYEFEDQVFDDFDTTNILTRIPVKDNEERRIRNITVSPRGSDVAYVQWQHGEYQVILEQTQVVDGVLKKERSVILSGGVKNFNEYDDPDYPLLSWNNTGFKLGVIFKNRDKLRIRVFNSVKAKLENFRIPPSRFDRITGFTFMEDDDVLILSAIKRGQSDLFEYRMKGGRVNQLTDDAWDDKNPVFVSGGARKGVIFISNRPLPYLNIKPLPNELPSGGMNAFFYNSTTKSYDLLQLTRAQKGEISEAIPYGSDHFAYLSDQNGIRNRYVVLFARDARNRDSAYSVPVTNFGRGIIYQQYNPASGKVASVIRNGNVYDVLFEAIRIPKPEGSFVPKKLLPITFVDGVGTRKSNLYAPSASAPAEERKEPLPPDPFKVETGETFQSEFVRRRRSKQSDSASVEPDAESNQLADMLTLNRPADTLLNTLVSGTTDTSVRETAVSGKRILYVDSTYIEMRSQPYRLSFTPDFFSLKIDNSVIFNRYQSYGNSGGRFANPTIGGMLMASLFDKMEDYRFTGGVRLPINFSGLSYFAQFENFRRRVDWGLVFMRQENKFTYDFITPGRILSEPGKSVTSILQANASYPLDKVKSFRLYWGLRQDRMVIKVRDQWGLGLPTTNDYWTMSRMEFVYDDARNPTLNIWNGLRYKLFAEYMYKLHTDNEYYSVGDTFRVTKNGGFYNLGMDLRYYHKIYKNFIAAIRVAGAHSGGTQQIIYFVGGVDNDVNPKFGNALPPSNKNNYAFQALSTNLRGYNQNARNGNTYALVNAELRFPILSTLLKRPIQSAILKHLQVVGFVDVGSAWEGLLPLEQNFQRQYTARWPDNKVPPIVQVYVPNYNDNGIAIGYGTGLRSQIFGYFLRFDAAWNIRKDFCWYISIGTDF